jgi:mono/diheme cytochrome c family protein
VPAVFTPASGVLLFAAHSQQVISLSSGDAVRGRKAFLDLQCHACHRVAEDETLPVRKDAWEGPVLRDLDADSAEAVAWKIVTRTELGPDALYESEMTETASAMTERQLVDLVAYLRDPAAGAKHDTK